jgi:hypothetical protein
VAEEHAQVTSEPLAWEALIASLMHELPQPVQHETALDGAILFIGGDPGEVVVRLTDDVLTVSEFAVDWQGPSTGVTRPIELGRFHWPWLPSVEAMRVLVTLIEAAHQSRRSKYRLCRVCERVKPPEVMKNDDFCQACADG